MGAALRIKQLRQAKSEIDGKLKALTEKLTAANRLMTEDESKEWAELEASLEANAAEVARVQRQRDREAAQPDAPIADPDHDATLTSARAADVQLGADRTADDPKKKFKSLGEFLIAVAKSTGDAPVFDPRLKAAASGMSEGVPSDGGYLVGIDQAAGILARAYETGEILNRVRRVPISSGSNGLKINSIDETSRVTGSRFGGVRAYWLGEGDQKTASQVKFRQMELNLKKLAALYVATDELLQDAAALESVVNDAISDELRFVVEDAILNGTGAGMPKGIFTSPSLVTVAKENGQAAGTIIKENIDKMFSRMYARSRANAVWLVNQDVEPQLFSLNQVIGTSGVPVYLPPSGITGNPFSTLYGRPVIPVEYASTLGTVGDIAFVDLSQYLLIDKGGIQQAQSMHVRFIYDETTFRFVYRVDGQPIWQSALTPYKGSNTQSPFIVLATRA